MPVPKSSFLCVHTEYEGDILKDGRAGYVCVYNTEEYCIIYEGACLVYDNVDYPSIQSDAGSMNLSLEIPIVFKVTWYDGIMYCGIMASWYRHV